MASLILSFQVQASTFDSPLLFHHLYHISSDEMQGRKPGSKGHLRAQNYIISEFQRLNLPPLTADYRLPFKFAKNKSGVNLAAVSKGVKNPDKFLVITAHYDHLGSTSRSIFSGADDNASGVAIMLTIANYLSTTPADYSVIFLATDAEESGLRGAKAFVNNPPVELSNIIMNINIDMIANGGKAKRFYIAGTKKTPALKTCLSALVSKRSHANFKVKFGHDRRGDIRDNRLVKRDWRKASDHYPFLKADIPYLYFGVSEHPLYHSPKDTFNNLDKRFFQQSAQTVFEAFKRLAVSQNRDLKNSTACLATIL